jgi:hypothetical protein
METSRNETQTEAAEKIETQAQSAAKNNLITGSTKAKSTGHLPYNNRSQTNMKQKVITPNLPNEQLYESTRMQFSLQPSPIKREISHMSLKGRKNELSAQHRHQAHGSSAAYESLTMQGYNKSPTRADDNKKRPTTPLTTRDETLAENESPRRAPGDMHDGKGNTKANKFKAMEHIQDETNENNTTTGKINKKCYKNKKKG